MAPSLINDSFSIERALQAQGVQGIAGVDEAGRGPLAGPVIAGAVILPAGCDYSVFKDSKKLSAKRREALFAKLCEEQIPYGVGLCSPAEIDEINILQASLLAMKRAVYDLKCQPGYLLIDGKFTLDMDIAQEALVKGEDKSSSIAAASIVAKVTRDMLMLEYDRKYPLYQFARHKGYPTKLHKSLIVEHGLCPIHRRTFKGAKEFCA